MNGEYVLLWSARQNALHIQTVATMLESNRIAYREAIPCDYVPLVIGSRELVDATADNLRGTMAQRQTEKAARADRLGAANRSAA